MVFSSSLFPIKIIISKVVRCFLVRSPFVSNASVVLDLNIERGCVYKSSMVDMKLDSLKSVSH